eukprot:4061333-Amphidinium_carterae.1
MDEPMHGHQPQSPKAKAKGKAKGKAKAAARPCLTAFQRPPSAPAGVPWQTGHHRLMYYKASHVLAIRQRNGKQLCAAKHMSGTLAEAYKVAYPLMGMFEHDQFESIAALKAELKSRLDSLA